MELKRPSSLTMLLWSAFALVLFTNAVHQGCSKRANIAEGPPAPATEVRPPDLLLKKMAQQDQQLRSVQSLTAKAKISSEGEGMSIAVNANIIWIRDSVIWLNAKKFGIEAVRVLITRDSVFVLNRLESTCTAASLESLRARYRLPDGDAFDILQRTLLGVPALTDINQIRSDIQQERHRLTGEKGPVAATYLIEEGSFLLKNELFLKKTDQTSVHIAFDSHRKVNQMPGLFSFSRQIETFSPESGSQRADIAIEDLIINNAPSYRFEIPAHYSRK